MTNRTDVFLSYARADAALAITLRDAMVARGLKVWFDETDVEDFAGITAAVEAGLANSTAFVALYSHTYPRRRACQWELTQAFLAAQRRGETSRLLVVSPEADAEHVEPVELRDASLLPAPAAGDAAAAEATAARIAAHLESLHGPLGRPGAAAVDWHGLRPVASARFIGRGADMWRVHSALQAEEFGLITAARGSPMAQAVGLGGIGKSLLAVEYALRYASAYPGGVFWLRAHGHDDIEAATARIAERESQLRSFAASLGVPVEGLSPPEARAALAKALGTVGGPYLWIVDDLPSDLSREQIDEWLAPTASGKTLVTTRSRGYGAFGRQVEVGLLDEAEGLALLRAHRLAHGPGEEEAARGLVRDLGGHALALDVAGAALAAERGVRSIADYRAALAEHSPDELEVAAGLAGELPTGHERSIAGTLLRSIEALGEDGTEFLRLASLLAVEPVPASLVVEALRRADNMDPEAARRRAVAGMNEAHTLSLAEVVGSEGSDRAVHALVSRTIRLAALPPAREQALRAAAVQALIDMLDPVLERRQVPKRLVAHARHLAESPEEGDEVVLLNTVSHYDRERGDFRSARALQERALETAKRLYGDRNRLTAGLMSSLGGTLGELGEKEPALSLLEQALDVVREEASGEGPATLSLMNNVAEARWSLGDFEGARLLHEEALAGRRRLFGDDHPRTLTSMNNLAGTLADLGEPAKAREGLEEVLAARRRILGEQHPDTLSTMNNLGIVLGTLGDEEGARDWHEKTPEGRRRALGERHPYTLTSTNNLAVALEKLGLRTEARRLHEAALQARLEVLGDRHPDTLTSMNNLASASGLLGDLKWAAALHAETLRLRREVLGPEHTDTVWSMSNLATTLWRLGDVAAGLELQEQALLVRRRLWGDGHPATVTASRALAAMAQGGGSREG